MKGHLRCSPSIRASATTRPSSGSRNSPGALARWGSRSASWRFLNTTLLHAKPMAGRLRLCAAFSWEGLTDPYRDIFAFGGLAEVGFPAFWWAIATDAHFVESEGCIPTDYLKNHPFYDDFWKAKAAKLEEITIPMLVCASFSDHGLHTQGSFRAFNKAQSEHKWVFCIAPESGTPTTRRTCRR